MACFDTIWPQLGLAVGVLEAAKLPPLAVCNQIAEHCHVP
jgi:hypothetical protein